MRKEILSILGEHINLETNRVEPLADELTALMCYREARGIVIAFKEVWTCVNPDSIPGFVYRKLRPVYGEATTLDAMERIRDELRNDTFDNL